MWRRWGPLVAVVAIQVALLAAIPLRQVRARLAGAEITLETVPVDPYDVLSGYYVTLRYEAEQAEYTGGDADAGDAHLVVSPASPSWRAITCSRGLASRGPDEVAIRVNIENGRCRIPSAGRFYIPEARRAEVEAAMRASGGRALVDMRVDAEGNAALLRLRVGDLVVGG
jgi:uncharacterized membrane-anchored protein